jgi:hypothetical protein
MESFDEGALGCTISCCGVMWITEQQLTQEFGNLSQQDDSINGQLG